MKTVLVTGSSGLVGTHLVLKLLDKGYRVIGLDIKPFTSIANNNYTHIQDDLMSYNLSALFKKEDIHCVFNAFGIKGSPLKGKTEPMSFLKPSIQVNMNIIEQCAKNGVWLIFLSSVGVYQSSDVFYEDMVWKTLPSKHDWFPSWSKRVPEMLIDACKVQYDWNQWTIIRPSNIFGEYDNFDGEPMFVASAIKKVAEATDRVVMWGTGTPLRDFIYAGDVADICIKSFEKRINLIVNAGSGSVVSIKDAVDTIIKVSGKKIGVKWDTTKPDGEPIRRMNIALQRKYDLLPTNNFISAIKKTYEAYINKSKIKSKNSDSKKKKKMRLI